MKGRRAKVTSGHGVLEHVILMQTLFSMGDGRKGTDPKIFGQVEFESSDVLGIMAITGQNHQSVVKDGNLSVFGILRPVSHERCLALNCVDERVQTLWVLKDGMQNSIGLNDAVILPY